MNAFRIVTACERPRRYNSWSALNLLPAFCIRVCKAKAGRNVVAYGDITLAHRVVPALIIRQRATTAHARGDLTVGYYTQRSSSWQQAVYLWNVEWCTDRNITDAVHANGSSIGALGRCAAVSQLNKEDLTFPYVDPSYIKLSRDSAPLTLSLFVKFMNISSCWAWNADERRVQRLSREQLSICSRYYGRHLKDNQQVQYDDPNKPLGYGVSKNGPRRRQYRSGLGFRFERFGRTSQVITFGQAYIADHDFPLRLRKDISHTVSDRNYLKSL
ncbi:hypothetical protein A0H81_14767 [Grifola frondosa]|uniref:Uncharacterized protein n=1 Tax=Grifola frondosa TaxID=5627 RepID=A0A1C7LMY5_GRIFR|nr:hypothetical protein A0H81_14767 [Grifola frondosa]